MYWRLLVSTLGIVFISEMGDKTQITTLLLAGANPGYIWWVALGSASALICASFLEVMIGSQVIARYLKPSTISFFSGIIFFILGILLLLGVIGDIQF